MRDFSEVPLWEKIGKKHGDNNKQLSYFQDIGTLCATMKRTLIVFFLTLVLFGVGCLYSDLKEPDVFPPENTLQQESVSFYGIVQEEREEGIFIFTLSDASQEEVLSVSKDMFQIGDLVLLSGKRDKTTGQIFAQKAEKITGQSILVLSPQEQAVVTSPLIVEGFASGAKNALQWKIIDKNQVQADEGVELILAQEEGSFGPFRLEIFVPVLGEKEFTLELSVFANNEAIQETSQIPLRLLSTDFSDFFIYVSDSSKNTTGSCKSVFPLERRTAQTSALFRASLQELFKGPSQEEQQHGSYTNLPKEAFLNSFVISKGIATVDIFYSKSKESLPSCQKDGLRSQIIDTLFQFEEIDDVVILMNGEAL